MPIRSDITITDGSTLADRCTGPAADGSCPRVAIGDLLPCASATLVPADLRAGPSYTVARTATLCPVTLAQALAVASDTVLPGAA